MIAKTLKHQFKKQAKEADRIGDAVLRRQAANSWRELATDSECARAPSYLTWAGRK